MRWKSTTNFILQILQAFSKILERAIHRNITEDIYKSLMLNTILLNRVRLSCRDSSLPNMTHINLVVVSSFTQYWKRSYKFIHKDAIELGGSVFYHQCTSFLSVGGNARHVDASCASSLGLRIYCKAIKFLDFEISKLRWHWQ